MSRYRYYTRPRPVEAAQWSTHRPGDVIGLLANHDLRWVRDEDRIVIHLNEYGSVVDVHLGDWLVIDGDEIQAFDDAEFRDRFEACAMRGPEPLVG
ncbi:hypothetical protein [Nocardiopsis alba]|uniref:hypothetical protein n=1 Tax=Nocardiopsis alba TaxID=53437 RepID=UPI003D74D4DE